MKITNIDAFRIDITWKKEIKDYMEWAGQQQTRYFEIPISLKDRLSGIDRYSPHRILI